MLVYRKLDESREQNVGLLQKNLKKKTRPRIERHGAGIESDFRLQERFTIRGDKKISDHFARGLDK